jgi:cell division protein FtsB
MEPTIAFVLGVLAVLALAGVVSMFKTRVQIKDLYAEIEDLQKVFNELEREIHRDSEMLDRRIDQEIDRIDRLDQEQYKYIDSRTDKMESRLENEIAQLVADVYSNMDARFNDNTAFVDKLYHTLEENKLVKTK